MKISPVNEVIVQISIKLRVLVHDRIEMLPFNFVRSSQTLLLPCRCVIQNLDELQRQLAVFVLILDSVPTGINVVHIAFVASVIGDGLHAMRGGGLRGTAQDAVEQGLLKGRFFLQLFFLNN